MMLYLPPRAYEFACHSEVCAPPNRKGTGGTGGSLKEGDGRNRGRAPHSAGQFGRPLPPPRGLPRPTPKSTNRKLAPHTKGEGKKLTLFPAPNGPNKTAEHDKQAQDARDLERYNKYEKEQKEILRKYDEVQRPKIEKRNRDKRAAEEAQAAKDEADSVAEREASYQAAKKKRADDREAAKKRADEIIRKHIAARAAARAKK